MDRERMFDTKGRDERRERMSVDDMNAYRTKASEMALQISEGIDHLETFIEKHDECFGSTSLIDGDFDEKDCFYVGELEEDMDRYGRFAKQLSNKYVRK